MNCSSAFFSGFFSELNHPLLKGYDCSSVSAEPSGGGLDLFSIDRTFGALYSLAFLLGVIDGERLTGGVAGEGGVDG